MKPIPKQMSALVLALGLAAALPAMAQSQSRLGPSQALSGASLASVAASGLVVQGSFAGIDASGQMVVASLHVVGESTVVVLRGVSSAAELSVQIAAQLAKDLSLAVGTTVQVTAEAAGYALIAAGRLIAYVPNEIGKSMLHQVRVR